MAATAHAFFILTPPSSAPRSSTTTVLKNSRRRSVGTDPSPDDQACQHARASAAMAASRRIQSRNTATRAKWGAAASNSSAMRRMRCCRMRDKARAFRGYLCPRALARDGRRARRSLPPIPPYPHPSVHAVQLLSLASAKFKDMRDVREQKTLIASGGRGAHGKYRLGLGRRSIGGMEQGSRRTTACG